MIKEYAYKLLLMIACEFKHDWKLASNRKQRECIRCGKKQTYIIYLHRWANYKDK